LHVAGEQIHVAVWPTIHEMHQVASRHYAFEARCFVMAAGLVMRVKDLPREFSAPVRMTDKPESFLLRGGSAIIGPSGQYIVEPCFDRETTIIAQLDLSVVDEERMTLDVSGHYNRPDIFDFQVRSSRNSKLQEDSS
jgi:nitrilase